MEQCFQTHHYTPHTKLPSTNSYLSSARYTHRLKFRHIPTTTILLKNCRTQPTNQPYVKQEKGTKSTGNRRQHNGQHNRTTSSPFMHNINLVIYWLLLCVLKFRLHSGNTTCLAQIICPCKLRTHYLLWRTIMIFKWHKHSDKSGRECKRNFARDRPKLLTTTCNNPLLSCDSQWIQHKHHNPTGHTEKHPLQ